MDAICMPVCNVNKLSCNLNALDFSLFYFLAGSRSSQKVIKLWHWINNKKQKKNIALSRGNLSFQFVFLFIKICKIKCIFVYMKNALDFWHGYNSIFYINLYLSVLSYFIIDIYINFCILFRTQLERKTIFREIYLLNKKKRLKNDLNWKLA